MLGHVVRICVADVARCFGERLGLLHDSLRGTCGLPARGGLGGSADQRVDDKGPYVRIDLFQDGAHGCPQLWCAHGFQRSVDLGVSRRHAMSPVAKTSHSALRAYALRRRRRVAVAERAWRACAGRNPATVVHSPRSTDFTSLRSPASNTSSCASRPRCLRQLAVVDPVDLCEASRGSA